MSNENDDGESAKPFLRIDRPCTRELCKRICEHSSIFIDWRSFNFIDRRPCHNVADVEQKHKTNYATSELVKISRPSAYSMWFTCTTCRWRCSDHAYDTIFVTDSARNSNCVWFLKLENVLHFDWLWMALGRMRMRWVTQLRKLKLKLMSRICFVHRRSMACHMRCAHLNLQIWLFNWP